MECAERKKLTVQISEYYYAPDLARKHLKLGV